MEFGEYDAGDEPEDISSQGPEEGEDFDDDEEGEEESDYEQGVKADNK